MIKYKTIVIDDIPENVEQISRLTKQDERFEVVATACNGADGLKKIAAHNPDLVLLDIEMPGMGGFDLVMALKDYPAFNPIIIFVTVYDEYAIQAIRLSAFDYILKTNLDEYLPQALSKFALEKAGRNLLLGQQIETLSNSLERNKQIIISSQNSDVFVRPADIIYLTIIKRGLNKIVLKHGEQIQTSLQLNSIEKLLPEVDFFRLDKRTLINVKHISEIKKGKSISGRRYIYMKTLPESEKLLIPVRKHKALMDFIDTHQMLKYIP
ncbi:MAG: LytTR family DNA-binding domain-containing protein [Bacteroidales bacterium]|nr:LytTR family DNA-binding domain-containing protein [Bacteroidales bacterium]